MRVAVLAAVYTALVVGAMWVIYQLLGLNVSWATVAVTVFLAYHSGFGRGEERP